MAKTLTLTLYASEIKQAVKSDSYITGQIDKSADMVKNAALAYNEQAGDEPYHETKLFRTMKGALAKLEAQIAEYVETSDENATVSDTLTNSETDQFTITVTVGSRTSKAFETTLAYLSQEFIINSMLYYWWQPIKPALAKDYLGFAAENIGDIRRCLAKSAPTASSSDYGDISGSILAQTLLSFPQSEYNAEHPGNNTSIPWDGAPTVTTRPSGLGVTYSTSNVLVANVNENGAVALTGIGDAVITARFAGNADYAPSSASYTIHVSSSNPFGPQP